jgi:DNA-binding transcriptional ArsR family regulator
MVDLDRKKAKRTKYHPNGWYSNRPMDLSRPHAALCPTLDTPVLAALAGTTRPLTGREVARLVGRDSHAGVQRVLRRLAEHGVVERREAGQALLYTLNRDHLAAPAVEVLVAMRQELLSRLRKTLAMWLVSPVHASLFGSAARGDGDINSDIDLFLVRPDYVQEEHASWRMQVDDLATAVYRWTGNRASIAEMARAALGPVSHDRPPVIDSLLTESILLAGPDLQAVLAQAT